MRPICLVHRSREIIQFVQFLFYPHLVQSLAFKPQTPCFFCHFKESSPYGRGQFLKFKSVSDSFFSESKIALSALAHVLNQNNLICTSKKRQ